MYDIQILKPYPLFRLTIPLVTGIFLSDALGQGRLDEGVCAVVAGCSFVLMLTLYRLRKVAWHGAYGCVAFCFLLSLGAWLTQYRWNQIAYEWPIGRSVYQGAIVEPPQEKPKTWLCKVRVDERLSGEQVKPVGRTVLLYVGKDSLSARLQCGDHLRFFTEISTPEWSILPGGFDYGKYLFRQQISGTAVVFGKNWQTYGEREPLTMAQHAYVWRERILQLYREWGFEGDELAVLSALTIGDKTELSDELEETYRMTGVSHILALSGMHVALLWALMMGVLRPLGQSGWARGVRCVVIIGWLWAFAFLVGMAASVVRAVIMCMLMTLAQTVNGRSFSLNTLAVAAGGMLLYNPFYLFDVGFQLSFIAVLSILLMSRYFLHPADGKHQVVRSVWNVVAITLAAQIGTSPLVMYCFSYFPVHFLLANVIVAPLSFLIIYGAVLMFLVIPWAWLHGWVVKGIHGLIVLLNGSMAWVEQLPYARSGHVNLSVLQTVLLYMLLGLGLIYVWYRRRVVLLPALCVLILLVGSLVEEKLNLLSIFFRD